MAPCSCTITDYLRSRLRCSFHKHIINLGKGKLRTKLKKWHKMLPAFVIAFVWGLLLLPIIFYHLPYKQENENGSGRSANSSILFTSGSGSTDEADGECLTKYTGMQCLEFLQSCSSNKESSLDNTIFIRSHVNDQSAIEKHFTTVMFGLDTSVQPSKECRKRLVPFLCLYSFGLCKDGVEYGPNGAECLDVRDNVCKSEWQKGNNLLISHGLPPLPDCSIFSDNGLVCNTDKSTQSCTIDCHDQFYCENNICKPRCDNFREYSYEYTVAADVLVGVVYSVGILCGIVILVITCIHPKRMLAFPNVLIVYLIITLLVLDFSQLLTILIRPALYCRLNDLVTSIQNPTTYCTISGFVLRYSTMQFILFWVMHISFTMWKIYFPISARSIRNIHRIKYVHGICLIIGLLLPLISPIANYFKGGFVIANFPPFFCVGREADVTFYVHILPINIILGIGTSLLVLIFWKLHKQDSLFRRQKSKTQLSIGTAERKVLLVLVYYIIVGVFILTTFTVEKRSIDEKVKVTVQFIQCEANGRNNTCIYDPPHNPTILLMSNALLGLFPTISLVFAVNVREVKALVKQVLKKSVKNISAISTIEADTSTAL